MTDAEDRLATLADYGLLDTPMEPQFDSIVEAAACEVDAPIAMISLIDARRQWFKARLGIDSTETPIEESFCAKAIEQDDVFVVPDASVDERFRNYPNVTGGPGIRFYAGAPLRMRNGTQIGTLCVIDVAPRAGLDDEERIALEDLARRTVAAFELRRDMRDARGDDAAGSDASSWLEQASSHLLKAWAALDQIGATAEVAHLERVIVDVDALRLSHG
ncbi:GAF domain-containing protein [Sphingomonadaceae bacterium OTU29MARTA1]|uniref:GAF domain-containing protein n=1 Tax=Sphingomonas sp. Leaf37 TaxID=2876552 RepID=UPI001E60D6BE|nr:GAF domain-containing protein [Sphingomonas sp. Leaf37]USU04727.1 GAF domain-containing protein [Sphingomonadaceae bacterium OTU29LAMAA1]USU08368.1 GAF domain-containing protein [Sphingomonadaceae bacterium OTU29MARTA1]